MTYDRQALAAAVAKRHVIQLADTRGAGGQDFAAWLQRHGHNARLAELEYDYIDGAATWGDPLGCETLRYYEDCWLNDT